MHGGRCYLPTFATISMKLCSNFQIEQGKYNFDTRRGRAVPRHEPGDSRGSRRQRTRFRIVLGFWPAGSARTSPFLLTPWSALCVSPPRAQPADTRATRGAARGARAGHVPGARSPSPGACAAGGGAARLAYGGASRAPAVVVARASARHMGDAAASSVETCGRAQV